MDKKTKKRMLMLSFVFLALGATATWASNDVLKVQSILGTAIQDIQKIYFSSGAVKDPAHPETEILMNLQNGSVHMGGRMMMAISGANDRMGKLSTGSSLFQGRNNTISGANSFLVGGSGNTIEQDATGSAILGGTSNKIIKGIASYILGGNKNTISGDNSFIIGGVNNKIEGNNSYIFGFTGVKINANNSVAFGKNIEIEKDNVFMWNGTTNKESASRENTFVMYAKNGLIIKDASNITVTKNNSTGALNVADGIMQISGEAVHCGPAIQGAIQYTGGAFGCFCGCNGTGWVSMTPTQKCRNLCPTIDGFSWDGALCKYSEYDERDSLTKAEACEAGNSSDIEDVTSSYFGEDYVSGWQWTCEDPLGGESVSCSTKRKLEKGRCGSTLNSCAGEGVLDTTSIRFVNHKNIWECLPVGYPVYWVEGGGETNTKQICSLCEDGYKNLKDASGNRIKDSDGSIKCFKIEGTSCKNDVTITTDWNVGCTSGGVAKSTSTDANGNKTWNCESPTGEAGEKFCHTCNASANYVWSGGTTNKCVLKKTGACANTGASIFAVNNQSTWCTTVGGITGAVHDGNTYKWYCKGENGGNNSPLCNYCAGGTVWDGTSCVTSENRCELPDWFTWNEISIENPNNPSQGFTIMDRNLGAEQAGGNGWWYQYGNNWGFSSRYGDGNTTSQLINTSGYGPSNPYCSGTLMNQSYSMGDSHWVASGLSGWPGYYYLWGGSNDESPNYGINPTTHVVVDLQDKQGPCPNGWHVPSQGEWGLLTKYFLEGKSGWGSTLLDYYGGTNHWGFNSNRDGVNGKYTEYFKVGGGNYMVANPTVAQQINPGSSYYIGVQSTVIRTPKQVRCFKDTYYGGRHWHYVNNSCQGTTHFYGSCSEWESCDASKGMCQDTGGKGCFGCN